jgi:hypothetical protein
MRAITEKNQSSSPPQKIVDEMPVFADECSVFDDERLFWRFNSQVVTDQRLLKSGASRSQPGRKKQISKLCDELR